MNYRTYLLNVATVECTEIMTLYQFVSADNLYERFIWGVIYAGINALEVT